MLHAVPGQFGDVDQAISAAQVNERAEVAQAADNTRTDFAFLEFAQEDFLAGVTVAAFSVTLAEDQPAALAVDLDHAYTDRTADVARQVLLTFFFVEAAGQVSHVAGRDEAAQIAEQDDQAAAVGVSDFAFPGFLVRQQFLGTFPVFGLASLRDGQHEVAFFVLAAHDRHVDLGADGVVGRFHPEALDVAARNEAIARPYAND